MSSVATGKGKVSEVSPGCGSGIKESVKFGTQC